MKCNSAGTKLAPHHRQAVQKLLSMFNPVGALIQAVIAIYNTIQFFIERARQIGALVSAIINSIAEIAGGNLTKAIVAVEDSLAKALPVAISFLANLVGIGGMAAKIKEIITRIRQPIDQVVGKVVGFVAGKAKTLIARIGGEDRAKEEPPKNETEHDAQVKAGLVALEEEQKRVDQNGNQALTYEESGKAAQKVKLTYPVFKRIAVVDGGETWDYVYVASPEGKKRGSKKEPDDPVELEKEITAMLTTHEDAYLIKLGPYADRQKGSIETKSEKTTEKDRKDMLLLGQKYGCHHTGNKTLDYYTPDHQAPTALFKLAKTNKYLFDLLKKYGVSVHENQRLYPQDPNLSDRQGGFISYLSRKTKRLIELRGE